MKNIFFIFIFCSLLSALAIYIAIKLAKHYSIADRPGGHKQHKSSTPFVGGVGIFLALCVVLVMLVNFYPEHSQKWLVLGLCSIIIFATGLADDILRLSYKFRLIIQAIVAFIMVLIGGIVLNNLGELFFGLPLQLGPIAIPFTIFAIIGGINIINMIDGIDGLSGSLTLVSLLLLGVVAYTAGDIPILSLIFAILGGVCGFLFFNLRYPSQPNARVFLGDNGSMLIGLLFAWLLVDLSQGLSPAMRPVVAIWLLAIPLMDAISVMQRRIRMGLSPFKPDWNHLHHILLKSGYRVEEVVFAIVSLQLFIGIAGLAGLYLGVPDFLMFVVFLLVYAGYYYLTLRPWHYIPALCFLHTRLNLTPVATSGKFCGKFSILSAEKLAFMVSKEIRSKMDFWVQIVKQPEGGKQQYALALNIRLSNNQEIADNKINRYITLLQQKLKRKCGIELRQLNARAGDRCLHTSYNDDFGNAKQVIDRRSEERNDPDRRISNRRSLGSRVLAFEVTWLNSEKVDYYLRDYEKS